MQSSKFLTQEQTRKHRMTNVGWIFSARQGYDVAVILNLELCTSRAFVLGLLELCHTRTHSLVYVCMLMCLYLYLYLYELLQYMCLRTCPCNCAYTNSANM